MKKVYILMMIDSDYPYTEEIINVFTNSVVAEDAKKTLISNDFYEDDEESDCYKIVCYDLINK